MAVSQIVAVAIAVAGVVVALWLLIKSARARLSLERMVPTGQLATSAASSYDSPFNSHSTITSR